MLSRRTVLLAGLAAPATLSLTTPAMAAEPPVYIRRGLAIRGTDPVMYFREGRPVAGQSAFDFEWNGAVWQFASAETRDDFAGDPARFAPKYGGYCAYAVSENYTAKSVPEAWSIRGDRLYLNFSLRVRDLWLRNPDERIAAADRNWPGVLG